MANVSEESRRKMLEGARKGGRVKVKKGFATNKELARLAGRKGGKNLWAKKQQ